MDMDVHKTRREIESVKADNFDSVICQNVRRYSVDAAIFDAYVHDAITMVFGIEDMCAGEDEIVFVRAIRKRSERRKLREARRGRKWRKFEGLLLGSGHDSEEDSAT
jgi:hypothetical protein